MSNGVSPDQLRELFEWHQQSMGYALAAIVEARPQTTEDLIQALRRAMVISQDAAEGGVADAATAPFLAMIDGAESFLHDSQETGPG